jgi:SAM-dependent methyltransferase
VTQAFGSSYADAYDRLYADKDYAGECDFIECMSRQYLRTPSVDILDLGCGTGRHALILGERGYRVVGVDRSAAMLSIARRRRPAGLQSRVDFRQGDVRSIRLAERFDVVVLMFAVLGYQTADDDVVATLETAAHHLRPGGIAVFDVWYGPAVEAIGPSEREMTLPINGATLLRRARGRLEPGHVCVVDYELILRHGGQASTTHETHRMRYFFGDELAGFLGSVGLELQLLSAFPDVREKANQTSWNAVVVAQAR